MPRPSSPRGLLTARPALAVCAALALGLLAPPAEAAPAAAKFLLLSTKVQRASDKDLAPVVSELILDALSKAGGVQALGEQDVLPFLTDDAQSQLVACDDDTACLLQIGGALGVDYLVAPSLGSLANKYMLTLRILHARTGTVSQRASQEVPRTEAALGEAICPFVQRLLAGLSATESRVKADVGRCAPPPPESFASAPPAPPTPKTEAPQEPEREIVPLLVETTPAPVPKAPEAKIAPLKVALRGGLGVPTGVLGLGLEVLGEHWGVGLGTGANALGFGATGYLFANGGPYVSAQALLVRPGPVLLALGRRLEGGNGFGAALTVGYDLRPLRWLSLKAGLGLGYNSAAAEGKSYTDPLTGEKRAFGLLTYDLTAAYVFDAPF